jgi:hypothetical protein
MSRYIKRRTPWRTPVLAILFFLEKLLNELLFENLVKYGTKLNSNDNLRYTVFGSVSTEFYRTGYLAITLYSEVIGSNLGRNTSQHNRFFVDILSLAREISR